MRTGSCRQVVGDEGTRISRIRRRHVSAPPLVHSQGWRGGTCEDGTPKALSVREIYVPSVCNYHGTRREASRQHAVHADCKQGSRAPTPPTLATLPTCFRAPATGADSTGSASFISDHMHTMHSDDVARWTTGRAADDGCSTKVASHLFTVVPPCYGLTTLLRRTLIYTLGRSSRARRDLPGQATDSTP